MVFETGAGRGESLQRTALGSGYQLSGGIAMTTRGGGIPTRLSALPNAAAIRISVRTPEVIASHGSTMQLHPATCRPAPSPPSAPPAQPRCPPAMK